MSEKIGLVTFGDGSRNWSNARNRLMRQAVQSKYFHVVDGHRLTDLADLLSSRDFRFIEKNSKSLGFCLFKPLSIQKHLIDNPEIDLVVYLDAGSEIIVNERTRRVFDQYSQEVRSNGFLGFQLDNLERHWTKADLFNLFETSSEDRNSGQIAGGHLLFAREFALEHCREWLNVMRQDDYHYLDNSPSRLQEPYDFICHRYDQSISSLLLKKYSKSFFRSAIEMEPTPISLESQTTLGPFVAMRNSSGYSRISDNRIKKMTRKISNVIYKYS